MKILENRKIERKKSAKIAVLMGYLLFTFGNTVFYSQLSADLVGLNQIYSKNIKFNEALESVMCDVIKIHVKRRDDRGSGKGNP